MEVSPSRIISQNYPPLPRRKHSWEALELGESHPTGKIVLIYPTRKIPLMKFTLLSKVSLLPHEIVSFYLICSCSHGYCIIFSFQASCVVLILINRCLLNVVFSMTNALNDQSSSKQNFCPLHLSILMRVFLFFSTTFFSHFMKFHLTSLQLGLHGLSANQI